MDRARKREYIKLAYYPKTAKLAKKKENNMAYDEGRAQRIREVFEENEVKYEERNMMGGRCFMMNDKMTCGTHTDKKTGKELLMARIGKESYEIALAEKGAHPMDFTGRPLKGFVFIDQEGYSEDEDLTHWIKLTINYNPHAKSSKKRKRN